MAAMGVEERVRIIAEVVTKGLSKLGNISKGISTVQRNISNNVQEFGKVIAQPLDNWKQFNKEGRTFETRGGRLANTLRMATHGLRGFRMEMLGVMFFGMNLQRMFLGFLQPVMESFGVFELFRDLLLLTFLPTMESLLEPMLKIFDWFVNLPPSTQEAIGTFVLLGLALSTLLMYFGVMALGIGSIIQILPILTGLFAPIGIALSGLGVGFLAFFAVIGLLILGFIIAWQENFGGIKEWVEVLWEGIKMIFSGALDVITGIVQAVIAIFKGDFDGFGKAVEKIWEGIKNIVGGVFRVIVGLAMTFMLSIGRIILGIYAFFYQAFERVFSYLRDAWPKIKEFFLNLFSKDFIKKAFDFGVDFIKEMIEGIKSVAKLLMDALISTLPKWAQKAFGGGGGGGSGGHVDDFIWRPGSGPVSINPNDTIVGAKGGLGGIGTTVNLSVNYNVNVSDKAEFERMMDNNNKSLVDDVKRMIGA